MLKAIAKKLVVALVLCSLLIPVSLLPGLTAPSIAATAQMENAVILKTIAKKDDVKDLRRGAGKIIKRTESMLEKLKESGQLSDNYQPIIVITREKREKDW